MRQQIRPSNSLEGNGDFRNVYLSQFMSRGKVMKELRQGILEVEGTLEIPPLKWCDGQCVPLSEAWVD